MVNKPSVNKEFLYRPTYRVPAGEFQYTEQGVTLRGETPQELVGKVKAYREANRIPVGDVESDVALVLTDKYPEMAGQNTPLESPESDFEQELGLGDRVGFWTRSEAELGRLFVNPMDAKSREAVCLACPHNKSVEWSGMATDLMIATRGESLKASNLGGCECWEHNNRLATLLADYKGETAKTDIPENCWCK